MRAAAVAGWYTPLVAEPAQPALRVPRAVAIVFLGLLGAVQGSAPNISSTCGNSFTSIAEMEILSSP